MANTNNNEIGSETAEGIAVGDRSGENTTRTVPGATLEIPANTFPQRMNEAPGT